MTHALRPAPRPRRRCRSGFTLIELMVVIGIIVLLAAILLPVVSRVRLTAQDAATQQQMNRIVQACQQYYHDFNAYPGPIANVFLFGGDMQGQDPRTHFKNVTGGANTITSSENLVLGLLGYVDPPPQGSTTPTYNNGTGGKPGPPGPPPHDVLSLNPLRPANHSYLDYVPSELSGGLVSVGQYALESMITVGAKDTNVPEFVDRFASPMPILYIRANVGGTDTPQVNNSDVGSNKQPVQYNYLELSAYGCNIQFSSGPKAAMLDGMYFQTLNSSALAESTTAYADWNGQTQNSGGSYDGYLTNPNIGGGASQNTTGGAVRGKDGFILISAGKDRIYGTHDDTIVTP